MKRIPELDAVRGLAAIGVVLHHAFPHTFFWAWNCVDLFFVLSGYLITTVIVDADWTEGFLRSFYVRRLRRIWPVYFLTLAAVVVANRASRTGYPTDGLGWHLIFLQNTPEYFGVPAPPFIGSFGPSWSVAIEEQFYLIWPLLLLAFGRGSIPLLAGLLLMLCAAVRMAIPDSYNLLATRGDGLALGCLLAWLLNFEPQSNRPGRALRWLVPAGAIGAVYAIVYLISFQGEPLPQWTDTCFTGFGLLFFACIGLCVRYSGSRLLRPLRHPVLRWFGTISYALYLFHVPIFHYAPAVLERIGIGSAAIRVAVTWMLLVVLPTISWYCLERPILGSRSRRAST